MQQWHTVSYFKMNIICLDRMATKQEMAENLTNLDQNELESPEEPYD